MKDIIFVGSSLDDIKGFPEKARREAGHQLSTVQEGEDPSDWKPMVSVGPGVREIRIKQGDQYRVIYVANIGKYVYVLHAFVKKTQKTLKRDIELAQARLKEIQ